jgi:asparagine synthase (glutamine-hydrolysing)
MDDINKKLLENIENSISETVKVKKIGIAFSGGVDSTLISKICSDMDFDVTLLTIGFSESHDILFAKHVNEFLKHGECILGIH